MHRFFPSCLLALSLIGCAADRSPVPAAAPREISANSQILTDLTRRPETLTLRGVSLGDDESAIRVNRILSRDEDGWIVCRDGCRYRIIAGRVVTLGVWDAKLLQPLGVRAIDDVEKVFGKADEIEKIDTPLTQITIFRYAAGDRRVNYDRMSNKLLSVNLGTPASATDPAR